MQWVVPLLSANFAWYPVTQSEFIPQFNGRGPQMPQKRFFFKQKRQCRDKGQKSDFYVFLSICFCQIPFTMLTMFVPVIRKTVSRFPCSLRFFFSVPLEIGHVPLFPQTPGRPSLIITLIIIYIPILL